MQYILVRYILRSSGDNQPLTYMKLSHEVKYILAGGSPTDFITLDGKIHPKVMDFLVTNQIPY